MIRSSRMDATEKKREQLLRQRNIAISSALFGAAIPITPLPLVIAIGVATAYFCMGIKREIDALDEPIIWDSKFVETSLPDCTMRRTTFLGQAMPFPEWRGKIESVRSRKGTATAEDIRHALNECYPLMQPFMLTDDQMTRHMAIMAATGTGKTELLLAIIQQQIRRGGGLILVEAKSDSDFAGAIYSMMREAGRLDQFKLINFEFPEQSHTYNPFFSGGVRATLTTAMKIQAKSKEEFWTDVARYTLSAAILTLKLQPGEPAFHIKDILALLSDFDLLLDYTRRINPDESTYHQDGSEWLFSFLRNWWDDQEQKWNYRQFKTLTQGIISKLSAFAHSEYARIVNTYAPDVDLKHSILNNEVVVLSMSSLADKDGVELFGKLFISDLARAIGEIQLQKLKPLALCPALFDEYPSFMDVTHVQLFQLARSANVPIIIAFQGIAFLQYVDPAFTEMVLGNCWNHIYCDIRDATTREFCANLAGTIIAKMETSAAGVSSGASHSSENAGVVGNESDSVSTSVSLKAQRETLIQPDDFSTLDEGDAILVGKSGTYRMRMPMVRNTFPQVHFSQMRLTRRALRPRPGIYAWEAFTKKNRSLLRG